MPYPKSIENLIKILSRLPTVGPKTAERYVFYLLKRSNEELQIMAQAIAELKEKIVVCSHCKAVSEKSPCSICSDNTRNRSQLCVVANTRNMLAIESTGEYKGYYHILGGLIDTINEISPEKLFIEDLTKKLNSGKIDEVILALSPTIEGETTAMYIGKLAKNSNTKITKLAQGLPTGADLEYADQQTISNALKYRNKI